MYNKSIRHDMSKSEGNIPSLVDNSKVREKIPHFFFRVREKFPYFRGKVREIFPYFGFYLFKRQGVKRLKTIGVCSI
jgi:hypothetical protein